MVKQYLFVDESGDTGSLSRKGSSQIFVLSAVYFSDKLVVLDTIGKLKKLKSRLKLLPDYEFKYHRSKSTIKKEFFENLAHCDCELFSLIVHKNSCSDNLNYGECLHGLLLQIQKGLDLSYVDFQIIIDGKASKKYLNDTKRIVRKGLITVQVNIRYSNSKNDELVQIADMISGLVYDVGCGGNLNYSQKVVYNKIRRFYHGPTRNAA